MELTGLPAAQGREHQTTGTDDQQERTVAVLDLDESTALR
jgi:hypothetical protein